MRIPVIAGLAFVFLFTLPALAQQNNPEQSHTTLVDRLNRHLNTIQIIRVPSPMIEGQDQTIYEIVPANRSNEPLFLFRAHEFIIDYSRSIYLPDHAGPQMELCQALKYIEFADVFSEELLSGMDDLISKISLSFRKMKIGLDLGDNWFTALAETTYVLTVFSTIDESRLLARGFADQSGDNWTRQLSTDLYDPSGIIYFHAFEILHETDGYGMAPTGIFDPAAIIFQIPDNYSNEHLPNLRARYVDMLTFEQIKSCLEEPLDQRTLLLDGAVIPNVNDPLARSVRVFVAVN